MYHTITYLPRNTQNYKHSADFDSVGQSDGIIVKLLYYVPGKILNCSVSTTKSALNRVIFQIKISEKFDMFQVCQKSDGPCS